MAAVTAHHRRLPEQDLMSTEVGASVAASMFWARGSECKYWRMRSHMGKVVSSLRLTVAILLL